MAGINAGGVDAAASRPMNRLVELGRELIPDMVRATGVSEDGRYVVSHHEQGDFRFGLFAIPQPEMPTGFFRRTLLRMELTRLEELPPVGLKIHSRIGADEFKTGFHTQLMGLNPYSVLEDRTHYGLLVYAPKALIGGWEDFQAPSEGLYNLFKLSNRTEIGRRRISLGVVFRVDDDQPLIRQQVESRSVPVFCEMLTGFRDSHRYPDLVYSVINQRSTVPIRRAGLGVGEEESLRATTENMIFSIPGEGEIEGNLKDSKGLVTAIVFSMFDKKIVEIINTPIQVSMPSAVPNIPTLTMRGYSPGETTFEKPQRSRVDIAGIQLIEPLAAFRMALVAERPDLGYEMEAATVE
ncbi:MAG: hypothetical protein AABZ57_02870 [Candidatus Margulisiibacteriota bacterium]